MVGSFPIYPAEILRESLRDLDVSVGEISKGARLELQKEFAEMYRKDFLPKVRKEFDVHARRIKHHHKVRDIPVNVTLRHLVPDENEPPGGWDDSEDAGQENGVNVVR